ncbi:MAG: HAD hydrolase family protein [Cyanobacteriota bacterium]|nr:HAD hydrolase family protein [Cyanobacteriota bacterium]MDY6359161.1 HAD hydrolase family protein [Cyanobacteriota bacterium]MDY6364509.1 HAD hydrolase family protein [Cyanobacteriota bacterium]MDY6383153.1 HAD hydrolase family protein [Cyanobacteriota bacterium]
MDLKEKASKIKLLVFDIDGVMTDGSITYDENGIEYKTFNAKDGHGIAKIVRSGLLTAIITGRKNGTVDRRAMDLKFSEVYQGVKNKLPILEALLQKYELDFSQVSYMGDDEPDIPILQKVGIAACPSDAVDKVRKVCNFISSKSGGHGAVRELCDLIFDAQHEEE